MVGKMHFPIRWGPLKKHHEHGYEYPLETGIFNYQKLIQPCLYPIIYPQSTIVDTVNGTVDMEVSSNMGTLNHPFYFRIFHSKPSSYWGTPMT